MPALVVTLLFLVLAAFSSVAIDSLNQAKLSRQTSLQLAQFAVERDMSQYFMETGAYPLSLGNLMSQPGYEHLRMYASKLNAGLSMSAKDTVQIAQSANLVDASWTYRRAAVITLEDLTETTAAYLGATRNGCAPSSGSLDFATASDWCPATNNGYARRFEQRETAAAAAVIVRLSQNFTVGKLLARFNTTQDFPAGASAVPLSSVVTSTSLGSSVGSSAATCVGTFQWQTIPMDCSDLYSGIGQPVSYQLLAPKRFILFSQSLIADPSGSTVTLANEVNLT